MVCKQTESNEGRLSKYLDVNELNMLTARDWNRHNSRVTSAKMVGHYHSMVIMTI